jgi:hypothetical protein
VSTSERVAAGVAVPGKKLCIDIGVAIAPPPTPPPLLPGGIALSIVAGGGCGWCMMRC